MGGEYIKKAKAKPVLKAPTFKYGGNSYVVLAYAKMRKKPFGIEDIMGFTSKIRNGYEVRRAIQVLIGNGSIQEHGDDSWVITPTGFQQVFDFAARRATTAQD